MRAASINHCEYSSQACREYTLNEVLPRRRHDKVRLRREVAAGERQGLLLIDIISHRGSDGTTAAGGCSTGLLNASAEQLEEELKTARRLPHAPHTYSVRW